MNQIFFGKNGLLMLLLLCVNWEFHIFTVSRFDGIEQIASSLKDKSGVDKIIVTKQPYQLLNSSREIFSSFQALNFHKFDD